MKKALIAGAASVALAALPVVGVFATTSHPAKQVTDNITMELEAGCTMTRETGYTETAYDEDDQVTTIGGDDVVYYHIANTVDFETMTPGTAKEASGEQVDIVCNGGYGEQGTGTWSLLVESGTHNATSGAAILSAGTGKEIVSGTNLDGDTPSNWAMKIADATPGTTPDPQGGDAFAIETGWDSYHALPTKSGNVTTASIATLTYTASAEQGATPGVYAFVPTYKISVDQAQPAGAYTGSVIYTIAPSV